MVLFLCVTQIFTKVAEATEKFRFLTFHYQQTPRFKKRTTKRFFSIFSEEDFHNKNSIRDNRQFSLILIEM